MPLLRMADAFKMALIINRKSKKFSENRILWRFFYVVWKSEDLFDRPRGRLEPHRSKETLSSSKMKFQDTKTKRKKKIKLQKQTPTLVKFLSIDLYLFSFIIFAKMISRGSEIQYTGMYELGQPFFIGVPYYRLKLRKKFHNQASIDRCGY